MNIEIKDDEDFLVLITYYSGYESQEFINKYFRGDYSLYRLFFKAYEKANINNSININDFINSVQNNLLLISFDELKEKINNIQTHQDVYKKLCVWFGKIVDNKVLYAINLF